MKKWWGFMVCIFTHNHVTRLVPLDRQGAMSVWRLCSLCPQCDKQLIELLDQPL